MKFKKENVYTALNATEELIGAKGYFAEDLSDLRYFVVENCGKIDELISLDDDFVVQSEENYNFFYLVEEAPKKCYVSLSDRYGDYDLFKYKPDPVFNPVVFEGTEKECKQWLEKNTWYVYKCDSSTGYGIANIKPIDVEIVFSGSKEMADITFENLTTPKYRPFKDADELIDFFEEMSRMKFERTILLPVIWVKDNDKKSLISDFDTDKVYLNGVWRDMEDLYYHYTFLNDKPCGVKVER